MTKFILYNTEYTLRAYTLALRDITSFDRNRIEGDRDPSPVTPSGGGDK